MEHHEDQSHFWSRTFRLLADLAMRPQQTRWALEFVLLVILLLVVSLVACPRDEVCVTLAFILAAAYFVAACVPRITWARSLFLVWNTVVLYGMLGWGVRVRRVVATGAICIVFFATVYYVMSAYFPQHGVILRADPETSFSANFITGERYFEGKVLPGQGTGVPLIRLLPGTPYASQAGLDIQRALYFSTVTFTTLGYGDYRPAGRLQAVAAVEATLGAILIALLTVVFARRFLRL